MNLFFFVGGGVCHKDMLRGRGQQSRQLWIGTGSKGVVGMNTKKMKAPEASTASKHKHIRIFTLSNLKNPTYKTLALYVYLTTKSVKKLPETYPNVKYKTTTKIQSTNIQIPVQVALDRQRVKSNKSIKKVLGGKGYLVYNLWKKHLLPPLQSLSYQKH